MSSKHTAVDIAVAAFVIIVVVVVVIAVFATIVRCSQFHRFTTKIIEYFSLYCARLTYSIDGINTRFFCLV